MTAQTTEVLAADAAGIAQAVATLRAGEVVALPTETVYGLAADATDAQAVARIYAAKGRPSFNPLIVHVTGLSLAQELVEVPPAALDLMARFWPGPLTLVLPLRPDATIAKIVTAGLSTLAIRCPDHPVTRAVIESLGRPIAAPSANASGRISPTRPAHVLDSLSGRIPLILDGGATRAGIESTIVTVEGDRVRLLRAGAVPAEALGLTDTSVSGGPITAPGQLASHYAPAQPVRLDAATATPTEFHIGFGPIAGDRSLSPTGDLTEAAANLFDALHAAQGSGRTGIAVAPIPHHGLGAAINDRLRRAAAPREGASA
ncbi:L-threonylcarbamoyladenylate synthase [Sphingoaurantiacus capsulatus]|uniref:Threonylcarbamoyl-AMP synthase n=1 Tax=Sphingoaurantiacus capsulatus TaxID=1771310 RepID=A0ABV7XEJ1_9SPHN